VPSSGCGKGEAGGGKLGERRGCGGEVWRAMDGSGRSRSPIVSAGDSPCTTLPPPLATLTPPLATLPPPLPTLTPL